MKTLQQPPQGLMKVAVSSASDIISPTPYNGMCSFVHLSCPLDRLPYKSWTA